MGTPLCQVSPDRSASRSLRLGMQDALTALEPLNGRIAPIMDARSTRRAPRKRTKHLARAATSPAGLVRPIEHAVRFLLCNTIVGSKTATLSACCNGAPAGIAGGSHVREGSPQQEDPRHWGESQS